jgi:hypothetical protein
VGARWGESGNVAEWQSGKVSGICGGFGGGGILFLGWMCARSVRARARGRDGGEGLLTNESIDLYRDDMAWAGDGTCGVRRMSGEAPDCPKRQRCGGGAMREV